MEALNKDIARDLRRAAAGYGRAGMGLMLAPTMREHNAQAAIGNLAIATELLLKAFIAKQNLALLYKDLPAELRCALLSPGRMPEGFRLQPYILDLKASVYKSLELDEAISLFYIFFPEIKQRLSPHLRYLARHRNICVHAVHPDCREYEVQRAAFLLLTLVKHIETVDAELLRYSNWGNKDKNDEFLAKFNEERLNSVHRKIEAARDKAKTLTSKISISSSDWDEYPYVCPVCGSDGLGYGETQAESHYDDDGHTDDVSLTFIVERFECQQCGLELDDYDEMEIAGMSTDGIDRSDESDRWIEERMSDYDESDYYDDR